MTDYIKQLRKFEGHDGYWRYYGSQEETDTPDIIESLLYMAKATEVDSSFEEGGRWSNYETTVNKVEEDGEVAYFEVIREVPGSESQDGMDLTYQFNEVYPHVVTTTIYKTYPQKSEDN